MTRYEECMNMFINMPEDLRKRIDEGIEQNRKGSIKVIVRDKNGKAVPNAKIRVSQKTHEFKYGANIFMLDELESDEKNLQYKKAFSEIFNQATLPFYWCDLEPVEGNTRFSKDSEKIYRRPAPDLCLEYCNENNITPKEHCLTYFAWQPDWVDANDIDDIKLKLEKRYKEISERYKDKIHCWEVTNELLLYDMEKNYNNAFFKDDNVLEWNFKLAEKYFPDSELVINEGQLIWMHPHFSYNRSPYYMMIERGIKNGARIDAIGMQFHVFHKEWEKYLYNPELLMSVLDTYAKLGLPIQITEITIPAYGNTEADEKLQADLIESLYTLWFSHKSVEMITYWNMVDGYAAFAPLGDMTAGENRYYGGLLNFDMTKKQSYDRIKYLFNEKWNTQQTISTDENGEADLSAFYGTYEIEVHGVKTDYVHSSKFVDNKLIIEV